MFEDEKSNQFLSNQQTTFCFIVGNNVRTTTVVVVVHTPHNILKNDCTCTSKCTVQIMPNPKKLKKLLEKKI